MHLKDCFDAKIISHLICIYQYLSDNMLTIFYLLPKVLKRIKNKKGTTMGNPNVHEVHELNIVVPDAVICCLRVLGFAVATENVNQLMLNNLLHSLSCRSKILARIEMRRIESKVLADCTGNCKTKV